MKRFQEAKKENLEPAYKRLKAVGSGYRELADLARECLERLPEDRPESAVMVAKKVIAYQAGLAKQLQVERDKSIRQDEKYKRFVQRVVAGIVLLLFILPLTYWFYHQRIRNGDAIKSWVDRCEAALRSDDAVAAMVAIKEIKGRLADGGGEAFQARIERCETDLKFVQDVDRIKDLWWMARDKSIRNKKTIATDLATSCRQFGIVPGTTSPYEAAQLVNDSLIKDRLLNTLDLWFVVEPSAELRAILRTADPDGYREGIRDTILAGNGAELAAKAKRAEALTQPAWFAAVLGHIKEVPVARRQEVLELALQRRPGDLSLLMTLSSSYPFNQREGSENRVRWLQAAVASHPQSTTAHTNLGVALHDRGDLEGAIREYKTAIALDAQSTYPHNGLALALLDKKNLVGALDEINIVLALDPKAAYAHNGLGKVLRAQGNLEGAIREFETAIAIDQEYALPHHDLGSALYDKGNLDGAIREFTAAIKLDPNSALQHNGLGVALSKSRDLDGATREFKAAISLDPNYALAHNGLGVALYLKGDLDGAIREHNKAIELDPKYPSPHNDLGVVLNRKGDLDGAIREYNIALKLDSNFAIPHNGLGIILEHRGNFDGAIREYNTAIKLDPKYAVPHNNLGIILQLKGNLGGAILEYNKAIELNPKYDLPHNGRGNILMLKHDREGAIAEYNKAIELNPNYSQPHNGLAFVLYEKGDREGAIREFKAAIEIDPNDPVPHNGLGNVLMLERDGDGAIKAFQEAARLKNRFAPTYKNLADLLAKQEKHFAALQVLRDGLHVDPEFIAHFRYDLARYACLLASGLAKDAPPQFDKCVLHREALGWLTTELASLRKLAGDSRNKPTVHKALLDWLANPDLASVREVEKLPSDERESWYRLWAEIRQFRDDTAPGKIPPSR